MSSYKIAIAGTGYVGLSNAILLSQHNEVYAVDIIEEKVNLINSGKSPIVDREIQEYLATKDLNLTATTDAKLAYENADFVIISTPTNYDPKMNYFDTSSVEAVIKLVLEYNPNADYDYQIHCSCRIYSFCKRKIQHKKYHLLPRIFT